MFSVWEPSIGQYLSGYNQIYTSKVQSPLQATVVTNRVMVGIEATCVNAST